jgi:Uma2 family endonuclease
MALAHGVELLTIEDLLRLPDDGQFHELDEGRLVCMPPAAFVSSQVALLLVIRLGSYVLQHGLGILAGADGGVVLGRNPDTVRAPDISFIRAERVVDTGRGYFEGAPDLAVEVLSPSDRYSAVSRKVSQYLAAGTRLVWVVDPFNRTVAVYRPGREVIELPEDGTLDGEDVVPGFRLALTEIWV